MNEVVWSDTALAQLDAIGTYIEQFNPKAAAEVAAHLIAAGNSLESYPHRGRLVPGTTMRELVITVYPYIIRYRIVRDTVQILRVRHTSRRPTNP
jgi:addiction module RelE/StbE family toxin